MALTILALLSWPALVMIGSPRFLGRARWPSSRPRLALGTWAALLLSGVACAVAALVTVIAAGRALACAEPDSSTDCSQAIAAVGLSMAGWLLTAVVGGTAALALYRAAPILRGWRGTRRAVLRACWDEIIWSFDGVPVVRIDSERCVARSLPGRHPVIVVSSAMCEALTPAELRVVIAHEGTHLRQHHNLLALGASLQRACVPALACSQSLERSVQILIELAADDGAARRCGPARVAETLTRVAALEHDPSMTLRADRIAA